MPRGYDRALYILPFDHRVAAVAEITRRCRAFIFEKVKAGSSTVTGISG